MKIFEIETNILKELIINNNFIIKISPCKDYYNNTYNINKGYIIPEKILIKYGSSHEIILNDYEPLKNIIK